MQQILKAHVEEEFEAAHANGPEGHKCHVMHGHTWKAVIEWEYSVSDLDEFGWGVDFGAVKAIVKALDHQELGALLPQLTEGILAWSSVPARPIPPSAENIARYIYHRMREQFGRRVGYLVVRVYEGAGNMVGYMEVGS